MKKNQLKTKLFPILLAMVLLAACTDNDDNGGSSQSSPVDVGPTYTDKTVDVNRDGKAYVKISDHIGVLPIVMVCPGDSSLVSDSSDERRRFSNAVLSQIDREFLSDMQRYSKLLQTRNVVLKGGADDGILETIDARLAEFGTRIYPPYSSTVTLTAK